MMCVFCRCADKICSLFQCGILGHNDDLPAIVVCTMKNTRECVFRVDQSMHLFYCSLDAQMMMMMMMCG
jgi:hypothetical protein